MKVWLIWVKGDNTTWLEAAWDDNSTAENRPGYEAEVRRVKGMCTGDYEMRIQAVHVPGVHDLFVIPTVEAQDA